MYEWLQYIWQFLADTWSEYKLWIVGGVCFVVGSLLTRAVLPSLGRWGYEKLVVERKSKAKDRKRKSQMRTLLRESFERNRKLLESIEDHMTGKMEGGPQLPSFNVDLPILESTAGLIQLEVVDDLNTYKSIDTARYELTHFARRIDWLADMWIKKPRLLPGPGTGQSQVYEENVFNSLALSTLRLVHNCQVDCRNAIEALDRLEATAIPLKRWWLLRKPHAVS